MRLRNFYVYILTNYHDTVLYIGVTSDLTTRLDNHKATTNGFSNRYKLSKLIYYEIWDTAEAAIAREKQLKRWHREWKFNLIKELNPNLQDLTAML